MTSSCARVVLPLCTILALAAPVRAQTDMPLNGAPFASFGPGNYDVVVTGTGLVTQPSSFTVSIPADATVVAAHLYLVGRAVPLDDTVLVNGVPTVVPEVAKAGPLGVGPGGEFSRTQRTEVTSLVAPGDTLFTVEGYAQALASGAFVVAVFTRPAAPYQTITLLEGNDYTYFAKVAPLGPDSSVGQFSFPPSVADRTATLHLLTGDGLPQPRGDAVWMLAADSSVTPVPASLVGGAGGAVTVEVDLLGDPVGSGGFSISPQLDLFETAFTVPAGSDYLAFQVESPEQRDGDSIFVAAGVLALPAPFCGDGNLDPGEECEPSLIANCSATCTLTEICTDFVDNDGDGLVDCLDPDCPCPPIGRDPGVIRFRQAGHDYFMVHGHFVPSTPPESFDLKGPYGVLLTNDVQGKIYTIVVDDGAPGRTLTKRLRYRYVDKAARRARQGVFALDVRYQPRNGRFLFRIKAYGDFSAATEALMALQWRAGDESYLNQSEWLEMPNGWKLELPAE